MSVGHHQLSVSRLSLGTKLHIQLMISLGSGLTAAVTAAMEALLSYLRAQWIGFCHTGPISLCVLHIHHVPKKEATFIF